MLRPITLVTRRPCHGEHDAICVALVLLAGILCVPTASNAQQERAAGPSPHHHKIVGITAPFREAVLSVGQAGRIARIVTPEGSIAEEGHAVFALEDGVQRARTEMAKAAAQSTLDVELARALWERARRDLDRLERLHGKDNASSKELNDARSDEKVARLEYELAEFAHAQAALAYQRERELLEQFHARAPFTGYVAEHIKHEGENVEDSDGVVRLVQVDPLQVLVDCPLALASSVRAGDRARVQPVDTQWPARWGEVVLASRVADGASQTFKVKLTVPNEDADWMSGLKVIVEFPYLGASSAKVWSSAQEATFPVDTTPAKDESGDDGSMR